MPKFLKCKQEETMSSMLFAANAPAAAAATGAAAATTGAATGGADPMAMIMQFLPLIAIFALFYFMFIMPQRKEQKKTQEMLKALKEGDKIVTVGGIVGIITKITDKEDIIQITVSDSTKLNVLRPYITKKVEKTA
jgi:preprotein translocase subunit YajC